MFCLYILTITVKMGNYKHTHLEAFSYLLKDNREWFKPKELGDLLGVSDQYIRNAIRDKEIFAHKNTPIRSQRCHQRIHRYSILMYLLKTANHTTTQFERALEKILERCPIAQLETIQKSIGQIIKRKSTGI